MSSHICTDGKWFTGENAIDTDFIRANEDLTPRGPIHTPISSAEVLTKFRDKAKSLGLVFTKENGALRKDGTRYMFTADVEDARHPDYALSVGFRQASDTSMAFSGMCGTSVFICSNGCCSSLIKPSKMRHTCGNVSNGFIDSKIDLVFERFLEDADRIVGQIEQMKATRLTDELVGRFIRKLNGEWKGDRFVKNPLIGSSNLMAILAELENPTLNSNADNSVFRLHNAATYVTTHKMALRNPSQATLASRLLNNTILGLIDEGFTPLGDVVDVEVEAE